jgi:hypothetical protein
MYTFVYTTRRDMVHYEAVNGMGYSFNYSSSLFDSAGEWAPSVASVQTVL